MKVAESYGLHPTSIAVLMCTYNGARWVGEQIETILCQNGVVPTLYIHDDGSSDGTCDIVRRYQRRFGKEKIILFETPNMGYPRSFHWLVSQVPDVYDYYAYADQDDYWLDGKLSEGVNALRFLAMGKPDGHPLLYGGRTTVSTEDLVPLYNSPKGSVRVSLGSFLVRVRVAAHTMVFNRGLKKEIEVLCQDAPDVGHDLLALLITLASGGAVYIDVRSFVLHRRVQTSLSSGGLGVANRVRVEWESLLSHMNRQRLAMALLKRYERVLTESNKRMLESVRDSKRSVRERMNLIVSREFSSGVPVLDLKTTVALIINRY